jgi:SEC-C motif-containing protein
VNLCPCGTEKEFSKCCEPFLLGKKNPATAEELMRSRYSAFSEGELDYILNTHHADTRSELDIEGVKTWALESDWLGLEILNTEKGAATDTEGKVEFRCLFNYKGKNQSHHELSTFKKEDGKWYFVDGVLRDTTYKRETAKVGRNDPCSCGSNKKYKKCCGAHS